MSTNMSWRKSSRSYDDHAIILVRNCVTALRKTGHTTEKALSYLASALQSPHRRMRTFFYQDGEPIVLKNEWLNLRYRAGLFFMNEAAKHRAIADQYEAEADALLADQLEFTWTTTCTGNSGLHGRTANGRV